MAGTPESTGYMEIICGTPESTEYYAYVECGTPEASSLIPTGYNTTYITPNPDTWDPVVAGPLSPLTLPKTKIVMKLFIDGVITDITPYVIDYSIENIGFGTKSTLSFTLVQHSPAGFDENGYPLPDLFARMVVKATDFNPLYLGRNAFANKILSHKYDKTRQVLVEFHTQFDTGVKVSKMPPYLLGTPRLEASNSVLKWSGEDFTALFERSGDYSRLTTELINGVAGHYGMSLGPRLTDIVPGDNIVNMAHQTMRNIASAVGISSLVLNFPDYPVRQLRMSSGRPLDWMEQIAEVYQARHYWQGDTMVWEPAKPIDATVQWEHVDYLNMQGYYLEQTEGWKNTFTVARLKDQSGVLRATKCVGGQCVGEQVINIPEPSNYVTILLKKGDDSLLKFENYRFYDVDGALIQGPGQSPTAASAKPIAKVIVDSVPYQMGVIQLSGGSLQNQVGDPNALYNYVPEYEYVIYGGSEATAIDNYDDAFTFTKVDAASVAVWGKIPDDDGVEMEQVPNATVAQAALNALMYENVRKIFRSGHRTPYFNPDITPNSVHAITHARGYQVRIPWILDNYNVRKSAGGRPIQEFTFYRGLVP